MRFRHIPPSSMPHSPSHSPERDASHSEFCSDKIDRRSFLGYAASLGAVAATFGVSGWAKQPANIADASEPVQLPDGSMSSSWEQATSFSKTYFVDNQSAHADDKNPGTRERPFSSIYRAAQVLQAGERVVIAAGTYRECVRPMRGGAGPDKMISYEAAPGATVLIKGSETLKNGWQEVPISASRRSNDKTASPITAWKHELSSSLFEKNYNPFSLPSAPADRSWLDTSKVDMGPYFRRRGLVFVDGRPLEPVEQLRELAIAQLPGTPRPASATPVLNGLPTRTRGGPLMQEIGGEPDGRFWIADDGGAVYIRLANGTPDEHFIEITAREQAFVPETKGLGYIRVKGLTFQHAGNGYPIPQRGLVSTAGGNHWILEDNTLEWANGTGLDIANGDWNAAPTPDAGHAHILRRNTVRYCGVEGIAGMGTRDTIIEDNLLEWCGWADAERAWEAAGVKLHGAHNLVFRRNVVRHIRHANALWLDSGNANCRITQNIFCDVLTVSAAVHMEMNLQPNQIDNNIIWDIRNAEPGTPGQRGCAGSGIFMNASDNLTIAHNLIGRCDNSGIFAIVREDRGGSGTASNNNVANNIFADCDESAIVFLNVKNRSDGNLFAFLPSRFLALFSPDSKRWMDLPTWRSTYGWDTHSEIAPVTVAFDPDRLELALSSPSSLPRIRILEGMKVDLLSQPMDKVGIPGPLQNASMQASVHVDPRHSGS
jgi:hypothetical protein